RRRPTCGGTGTSRGTASSISCVRSSQCEGAVMMETRSGYDYAEIAFDKNASVVERTGYDELLGAVGRGEVDDVVVLVHGWNNDMADARLLYQRLAVEFRKAADSPAGSQLGLADRRVALLGLLWPSAKFAERD